MTSGRPAEASRAARSLRGLGVAVLATLTASVSHTFGGADTPPLAAVVIALLVAVPLCIALVGRRLRVVPLVIGVGISQALFHVLFAWMSGPATLVQEHASVGHAAHTQGAVTVATDLVASGSAHLHVSPAMIVAHAIAGALTVAGLLHGARCRRILAATARLVIRRVVAIAQAGIPAPPVARRPLVALVPSAASVLTGHGSVRSRRGPPALLAS